MTTQIREIVDSSGMSVKAMARCLSRNIRIDAKTLLKMMDGEMTANAGVIGDALQVLQDIDYVDALVQAHPEIMDIHPEVFKLVIDNPIG